MVYLSPTPAQSAKFATHGTAAATRLWFVYGANGRFMLEKAPGCVPPLAAWGAPLDMFREPVAAEGQDMSPQAEGPVSSDVASGEIL